MRKISYKLAVCFFALAISISAVGQKKNFTYEQLYNSAPTNFTKTLPSIKGWADNNHYLELRRDEKGNQELVAVNIKTGNTRTYEKTIEPSLPSLSSVNFTKNEKNPTFSPDGKWVAFTRNNNLYALEVASKKELQLTTDGSDSILNGYASWVYYEEILGRSSQYRAFWWSPDSRNIVYMRFDDSPVPVYPIYVSSGQHGYLERARYPKPGDKNPEVRIGITSVENPKTIWADFNQKDDQYFGQPIWTPAGRLLIQWMNRQQDNLKVYGIDLITGRKEEIYDEKQKTWIDLDENARFAFLTGGQFIIKSDKDGWENLYLHDATGKLINQVTSGNFWGTAILKVDEKSKSVYFRARKENSARFDIYKANLHGKSITKISSGDYNHEQVYISPDGKHYITCYSNLSTPTTIALADAKGKIIREIGSIRGPEFDNYNLPRSVLVRVKSADSLFDLPVIIKYPVNFDSTKRYPVIISIYGGPNAGSVYDRWQSVGNSTQWLAQEGVIQVAFDNRSSGHFGKNGLNYIHRQLGKWEIEDYMACGKWLRSQKWIDTNKVAMTGGSFGGYMTCMALTYGSDIFTHGIANASVTDWHLYDSHYTERYMDTPGENSDGYKTTSVLTYAAKYKGLLRIIHGSSDDNVHMQNSVQFINLLQNMGKHFELMLYPGERHGIGAVDPAKSIHNQNETMRFWYQNLLNKPVPAQFSGQGGQRAF